MYYKLDENNNPVPSELMEWATRFEDRTKDIVAQTTIGTSYISTVFLGLNHNYSSIGPPLLWGTMVFREGESEEYQERYSSYQEAVEGHLRACLTIDPDYKLMEFPEVDLVKIYEEAKEKYSETLEKLKD